MENQALLWTKNADLESPATIGVREGFLYKVPRKFIKAMIHDTINPCELWHKRFGHFHFKALLGLQKMVKGMCLFQSEYDRMCRGCALRKNIKKRFLSSTKRSKGILDLMHLDLFGPMSAPSLIVYMYFVFFINDFSRK